MKNIKKLLPLSLAILLAGCNGGSQEFNIADKISLNYEAIALFVGESKTVETRVNPRSSLPTDLSYESSDSSVVTVSDKGELNAKKAGSATITVKDKNSETSTSLYVTVDEDNLSRSESKKAAKVITDYQTANKMSCRKANIKEYFYYSRSKNDVLQTSKYYEQDMIVSMDDAFFYISSDDEDIKVEGGSKEYSNSAWYIYTNDSFDTYLFHVDGATKTYMVCDTTSFISSGGTRFDALCEVLDNLFTSGKGIILNQLANVTGSDNLKNASSAEHAGSRGDGYLTFAIKQTGSNTADKEDEDDNYIPYGTKYDLDITVRYAWEKYLCVSEDLNQKMSFSIGDDNYVDDYVINYHYKSENVELNYPNRDEFTKVDDIFDL